MDGSDERLWLWNFAFSHTLAAVRMHEGQPNHSKIYAFSSSSSSSSFARVFWNWSAVWTELIDMNGINKHEIETALNAMPRWYFHSVRVFCWNNMCVTNWFCVIFHWWNPIKMEICVAVRCMVSYSKFKAIPFIYILNMRGRSTYLPV